jgi:hypothetical protein
LTIEAFITIMTRRFLRKKWLLTFAAIAILLTASFWLVSLKFDYERENDAVLEYFSRQQGMPDAFTALEQLTSPGSVVLCWWDYGRAVREWSQRNVIEAYPSQDIWSSVGTSRTFLGNLKAQLFGTWGSSKKIHDLANIFMQSEDLALPTMRSYNVTYALVFKPDDLQKFPWIAEIAGCNSTEYLTHNEETDTYAPTVKGAQATLLRLIFDDTLHPQHFTRLYDNNRAKIYQVDYP